MRRIGYVAKRSGLGVPALSMGREPPHPDPLPSGERETARQRLAICDGPAAYGFRARPLGPSRNDGKCRARFPHIIKKRNPAMGGTTTTNTSQANQSQTNPWAPTLPLLNGIISNLNAQLPNVNPTGI